jgi:hypothetical protein
MGGNAFKGKDGYPTTSYITKKETFEVIDALKTNLFDNIGIESFAPVGSTTKSEMSNDVDIAISIPYYLKDLEASVRNTCLVQLIESTAPKYCFNVEVKKVGSIIALKWPKKYGYVQVDLIPTHNVENKKWLMWGGGGRNIKGLYRNLLLSYMFKSLSRAESILMNNRDWNRDYLTGTHAKTVSSYTFSYQDGLKIITTKFDISSRQMSDKQDIVKSTDPCLILNALGIDYKSKNELDSFNDNFSLSDKLPTSSDGNFHYSFGTMNVIYITSFEAIADDLFSMGNRTIDSIFRATAVCRPTPNPARDVVEGYADYIASYVNNPVTNKEAMRSLDYLKQCAIRLELDYKKTKVDRFAAFHKSAAWFNS